MNIGRTIAIALVLGLGLGAAACVDDAGAPAAAEAGETTETTQELQGSCKVYQRGMLVVSDGYWADPKTCCKRVVSSLNEQRCYVCTDPLYDCVGTL